MPAESRHPRNPRQNPAATADTLLNVSQKYMPTISSFVKSHIPSEAKNDIYHEAGVLRLDAKEFIGKIFPRKQVYTISKMKNILLLTVACFSSCLAANAQEIVTNGSFETTGEFGINQITNWTKGGISGSVQVVTNDAVEGSKCIQINSWSSVSQNTILLQAGKRYNVSYYVRGNQLSVSLSKGSAQFDIGSYLETGTWVQVTRNVNVIDTGVYTLTFSTAWSKVAKVDAVSIIDITPPPTTPEIRISQSVTNGVQINFVGRIETSTDLVTWSALDPQPASPYLPSLSGNKQFWRAVINNP